jgi:hypothetical protein
MTPDAERGKEVVKGIKFLEQAKLARETAFPGVGAKKNKELAERTKYDPGNL